MKFLICGVGSIGLRHLRNLKQLGQKDIILYSTGKSVMLGAKEETKGLKVFSTLEAALAEKPDVCMITNPTSLHIETALKAAKAGCHLYIEKPLANNLDHLDELQAIASKQQLVSLITYQFRYNPHIKLLKSFFINSALPYGKPVYATAEWSEYLPDWHPWEDYKTSYSANSDLGGGVLLTQIHPLNYLSFIFGPINNLQVNKKATKILEIEVDDVADLLISFPNGVSGHVHIDFLQKPRVHTMKIVTSKGRFEWNYHQNSLQFIDSQGEVEFFPNNGFERNEMFVEMLQNFICAVKNKKDTLFNLEKAITELRLLLTS